MWPFHGSLGGPSIALPAPAVDQDLALAGMIGLADDPFLLHPLHDRGGAIVADLQPPLDVAGRSLTVAQYDLHSLLVEVGRVAGRAHACCVEYRVAVLVFAVAGRDVLEILRRA